jgi:U4/U6.U5 tri-snRNP component SNU23
MVDLRSSSSTALHFQQRISKISTTSHTSHKMSKPTATGAPSSDTAFRKTWDRDEYTKKAADEEAKRKAEGKARYEAKLLGKKYHAPVDYGSLSATTARQERLKVDSMVGKTTIVPAGAALGKRGRGAGFYCDDCDLTFKDNIQLVEHFNSKQHLIATGQSGEVARASVEDVRMRLRMLAHRKRVREDEERRAWQLDLGERLREREEIEAKEREERRRKRNEKRRKGGDGVKQEDSWEGRLGIIA